MRTLIFSKIRQLACASTIIILILWQCCSAGIIQLHSELQAQMNTNDVVIVGFADGRTITLSKNNSAHELNDGSKNIEMSSLAFHERPPTGTNDAQLKLLITGVITDSRTTLISKEQNANILTSVLLALIKSPVLTASIVAHDQHLYKVKNQTEKNSSIMINGNINTPSSHQYISAYDEAYDYMSFHTYPKT